MTDRTDTRGAAPVGAWLLLAGVATALGMVVAVVMSYVKNAPFPPTISVSAYGLPPNGWLLTLSATLIGLGSVPLIVHLWTRTQRIVPIMLIVWSAGIVTLGWVHTNLPHTPADGRTLVHQAAACLAMIAFPIGIGILTVSRVRTGVATRADAGVMFALVGASIGCLVLLFFAAFGVDTAGIGSHRSWALYQFTAAVIDLVLVLLVCGAVYRDHRRLTAQAATARAVSLARP